MLLREKCVFDVYETKSVDAPKIPELSVKRIWPIAITVPGFIDYMPRDWTGTNHKVDRDYFYKVLATINLEFTVELIPDIRRQKDAAKVAK